MEEAALDHADYLEHLAEHAELLRRQILLVLREPVHSAPSEALTGTRRFGLWAHRAEQVEPSAGARRAATTRLVRRMQEATELLSPAGIVVTPLDAAQATAVLASATNPDSPIPPSPDMAGSHDVITTSTGPDWEEDTL